MKVQTRHLTTAALAGLRWRGYVRESTEAQADKWSPERQRADLERASTELGLVPADPRWYERTGTGEARSDELGQALADAGQYDVLLVLTTSRFARNRTEAVRRKAEFAAAGIPIYFVQDRILSGTRHTRLLEGVREVIDEEEQETRRYWIAGGIRERQFSGRWVGRLPYGFRKVLVGFPDGSRRWDGGLEPDPETAPIVRTIFEQAAIGVSMRAIALTLNVRGVRTMLGEPWSARTLNTMVVNPVYIGQAVRYRKSHGGHYYPEDDAHDGRRELGRPYPPIVEDDLFEAVAKVREMHVGGRGPHQQPYPLSRVLHCVKCGYRMSGAHSHDVRYYRCIGRALYGLCDAPYARADVVEDQFADWLARLVLPADWRAEIARGTVRAVRSDEADRQKRLAERLTRLRDLYAWGDLDEGSYRAQSAEVKAEVGVMAKPEMASLTAVAEALRTLGPAWRSAARETQAAVPPLMLNSVEVEDGRVIAWVVRAELRPLLEVCLPSASYDYPTAVRYSA